jgi:hypothetical protein
MAYIRLYLVPTTNGADQQVIDVDSMSLVLSKGAFVPVQNAPSITLIGAPVDFQFTGFSSEDVSLNLSNAQQQEVRVCWREPVGSDDFPNETVVTATDPSGGVCVCGITCQGTNLSYVQVSNVQVTA